jgi:hypothetical protein
MGRPAESLPFTFSPLSVPDIFGSHLFHSALRWEWRTHEPERAFKHFESYIYVPPFVDVALDYRESALALVITPYSSSGLPFFSAVLLCHLLGSYTIPACLHSGPSGGATFRFRHVLRASLAALSPCLSNINIGRLICGYHGSILFLAAPYTAKQKIFDT